MVLMDMQMPVMDGYEATMRIRSREEASGTYRALLVALTAHAHEEEKRRIVEAGCDAVLTKPIKKKPFTIAIRQFAESIATDGK